LRSDSSSIVVNFAIAMTVLLSGDLLSSIGC
jgi:hypothetical protein